MKQASLGVAIGVAAVACMYGAIRYASGWWWLVYWAVVVAYKVVTALLFRSLVIPLFYRISALPEGEVEERLRRLMDRLRVPYCSFAVLQVGTKTRRANALTTGAGKSTRILLTDTLLSEFSPSEIEALAAHELGHHVHRDLTKRLAFLSIIYLAGLGLVQWIIAFLVKDPENLANTPIYMLAFVGMSPYIALIFAAFVRRQERAADRYAWKAIEDINSYITAMKKLQAQNMISYGRADQWGHTHPAIEQRIKDAEKMLSQRLPATGAIAQAGQQTPGCPPRPS